MIKHFWVPPTKSYEIPLIDEGMLRYKFALNNECILRWTLEYNSVYFARQGSMITTQKKGKKIHGIIACNAFSSTLIEIVGFTVQQHVLPTSVNFSLTQAAHIALPCPPEHIQYTTTATCTYIVINSIFENWILRIPTGLLDSN